MRDDPRTVTVSLSDKQRRYLAERLKLPPRLLERLGTDSAASVTLTSTEARQLMAAVSERLQTAGFDAAYDPTVDGLILESIVDQLTAGS
jgi:hypothetical protein